MNQFKKPQVPLSLYFYILTYEKCIRATVTPPFRLSYSPVDAFAHPIYSFPLFSFFISSIACYQPCQCTWGQSS